MSAAYITQCPQCDTRFKVTLEQLNKAHGLVRCGSCMKVFSGDQYLVNPADLAKHPEADESTGPDRSSAAKPASTIPRIPLQIRQEPRKKSPWAAAIWGTLTLCGTLLLAGQILWFERGSLSQHPLLAFVYKEGCEYIDCRFSARQDLPLIVNHNLIVRDHPKYLGALAVDLLIENQAPFAQPFPAIQLVFTDLNGDPKAARSIQPAEYLGGDFGKDSLMPSRKPIQLQIELLDPGAEAPNYRLQFVHPQQSS